VVCGNEVPFAWNGANYFNTGQYIDTLVSATGCDSVLVLNLNVLPLDTILIRQVICQNETPIMYRGKFYFNTGIDTYSLPSPYGCDTTVIVDLTVLPLDTVVVDTSLCENSPVFAWNSHMISTTRDSSYVDKVSNILGCDSLIALYVTIIPATISVSDTILAQGSPVFAWNGQIIETEHDSIYQHLLTNIAGCDSILVLNVYISVSPPPPAPFETDTTICEDSPPFVWNGQNILTDRDSSYVIKYKDISGMDSTLILNVDVIPLMPPVVIDSMLCAGTVSFAWNGQTIFTYRDSVYQATLTSSGGCDSIVTLNIKILPTSVTVIDSIVAQGSPVFVWNGQTIQTENDSIYQVVLTNVAGCDSTVTIKIKVVPVTTTVTDTTICEDSPPFVWNGQNIVTDRDSSYVVTHKDISGMDSTLILNVFVMSATTSVTDTTIYIADLPFVWNGNSYNTSGIYKDTLVNAYGCDSLLTLNLTVLPTIPPLTETIDTAVCVQDLPVVWNGEEFYNEGVYSDTLVSVTGLDSIVKLKITVIPEIKPVFGPLGPYCQFSVPDTLPSISNNDITGSWSQSAINTNQYGIQLVTFTPDSGQCAATAVLEIEIIEKVVATVSIVADKEVIAEGESVTFTAYAVNGGTAPNYTWFVNGVEVPGVNSAIFTYKPQNNDAVSAVLRPDLNCVSGKSIASNIIIIQVIGLPLPVSVTISANQTEICDSGYVTFTALPVNGGTSPVYAWFVNGVEIAGQTTEKYTYQPQNGDIVYTVLTSSLTDVTGNPATSNKITIMVTNQLTVSVGIISDKTEICAGETVTFTATPVNGGTNPVYAWFVNNIEITGETAATFAYKPQNSDLVYATLTSDLSCATGNPATSNKIAIKVNDNATVSVFITASQIDICESEPVTFTAVASNGGTNPVFAWYVNNTLVPGETSETLTYTPKNLDKVYTVLTSNLACTTDDKAFSNTITIYVGKSLPVSVSITAGKDEICDGEMMTFTASPVNGGTKPVYAWFVNGFGVKGESSAVLTYPVQNGDEVYTRLTSNASCTTGNPAISNKIRVIANDKKPVTVSIVADKTEICSGETVTFTATPENGGTNPVYEWFVNGLAQTGESKVTFSYKPADGDEVYVKLISNETCIIDPVALSNKVTITYTTGLPVKVEITANPTSICPGETVIFTATPFNGGANPVYAWFVNGKEITGETGDTFVYKPAAGDEIYVRLTSSDVCVIDPVAFSDKVSIKFSSPLPVSVSIIADNTEICDGEPVTYTASPLNGGTKPVYAWFVNGIKVAGQTDATFTYFPKKGDEVYTVLTSDLACVTGNPATSNKISIKVNDKMPVSVSIVAGKTEICTGETVKFTAIPVNGGSNPVYAWFVNGILKPGETKATFIYNPDDGDKVYVKLVSNEVCIVNPVALSDTITITLTDGLQVSVDIEADKTLICPDETVTFTANPFNGGANPVYAWFVNAKEIAGANKVTFSYKPAEGDEIYVKLTSSEFCAITPVALSDTIAINFIDRLPVEVDIEADKTTICEGETVTFNAIPLNGGDNPVFAWFVNGNEITGENGDSYTYIPNHDDKVYVKLTSDELCVINSVALSDTITVTVTNKLVVSVTIPKQMLICDGDSVTITATPVNGGANPVYSWFVNKVNISGANTNLFSFVPNNNDEVFVTLETDLNCVVQNIVSSNVLKINIGDTVPPVAECRNFTVYLDADGKASVTTAQINNGSYDNCELDTLYLSRYHFGCSDVGKNPVTLTAVDAVGLTDICVATVTVLDTVNPVVICRGPFEIQLDKNAEYKLTVAEVLENASDVCGIDTMYVYPHQLDCENIGLTTITLWVVGVNGDSSYCQTEVMIYGNRPPNVIEDSAVTKENIPVVIDVVENDFDEKTTIDVSSLSISVKPLHGRVSVNAVNGDLTYTPNRNFSGVDVLQYSICDDGIPCEPECGTAYVYIVVEPVNDKPEAVDDYYNAGCFSVHRNVLENDTDPDGTDNLFIITTPAVPPNHGQLIIDPDGTINYFPNEGYIGIDSFQYVIWDNGIPEPLSDSAWVYIDIDCSEETQDPLDCELFIPEGFSPNEDGIHDFFRIMCIHNYPNAKLMIFNRSGDLLWQKQNYGNYEVWGDQYNAWWWGTSVTSKYDIGRQTINGEPKLKVGNYIYILDLGNGGIKNGTVMISY
jgi:gliding motility-associated-like protein